MKPGAALCGAVLLLTLCLASAQMEPSGEAEPVSPAEMAEPAVPSSGIQEGEPEAETPVPTQATPAVVPEVPEPTAPPAAPEPPLAAPVTPPAPKPVVVPRDSMGRTEGGFWIGQRTVTDRYVGWGWVKEEKQNWRSAKWVMLLETPGQIVAPHRFLSSTSADEGIQYKLFGRFADFKGYEPNYDVFVDVFILEGFEKIGPGLPIKRQPPRGSGGRRSIAIPQR
jgi:hypothetical protein